MDNKEDKNIINNTNNQQKSGSEKVKDKNTELEMETQRVQTNKGPQIEVKIDSLEEVSSTTKSVDTLYDENLPDSTKESSSDEKTAQDQTTAPEEQKDTKSEDKSKEENVPQTPSEEPKTDNLESTEDNIPQEEADNMPPNMDPKAPKDEQKEQDKNKEEKDSDPNKPPVDEANSEQKDDDPNKSPTDEASPEQKDKDSKTSDGKKPEEKTSDSGEENKEKEEDKKEEQPETETPEPEEKESEKKGVKDKLKDKYDNSAVGQKVNTAKQSVEDAKQKAKDKFNNTKLMRGVNAAKDKVNKTKEDVRNRFNNTKLGKGINKAKEAKEKAEEIKNKPKEVVEKAKEKVKEKTDEVKNKVLKKLIRSPWFWIFLIVAFLLFILLFLFMGMFMTAESKNEVFDQKYNYENAEFEMRINKDDTFEVVGMKKLIMGAAYAKYHKELKKGLDDSNLIELIDTYMVYTRTRALTKASHGPVLAPHLSTSYDYFTMLDIPYILYSELNTGIPYCNPYKGCNIKMCDSACLEEIKVENYTLTNWFDQDNPNYMGKLFYTAEGISSDIPKASEEILSLLEERYEATQYLLVTCTQDMPYYSPYSYFGNDDNFAIVDNSSHMQKLPDYNKVSVLGKTFEEYIKAEFDLKEKILSQDLTDPNDEYIIFKNPSILDSNSYYSGFKKAEDVKNYSNNLDVFYNNCEVYKSKPLITPLTMALLKFREGYPFSKETNNDGIKNYKCDSIFVEYSIADNAFKEANISNSYAWPVGSMKEKEVPKSIIEKEFGTCPNCDEKGIVIKVTDPRKKIDVCAINFGYVIANKDNEDNTHTLIIVHDNGLISIYENLSWTRVYQGSEVTLGERIGEVWGDKRLKIQIKELGENLNPLDYINIDHPRTIFEISSLEYEKGSSNKETLCKSLLKSGYGNYAVAAVIASANADNNIQSGGFFNKEEITEACSSSNDNIKCQMEKMIELLNKDQYYSAQVSLLHGSSADAIARSFCKDFVKDPKDKSCENISAESAYNYVNNGCSDS